MFSSLRPLLRQASPIALSARSFRPTPLHLRTLITTKYTTDHEWLSYDDATSTGTIGITDYAQHALGDVVYVELPVPESEVVAGETMGAVESVKAASDIFAPVSGSILEVNSELGDSPGLLNTSPEEKGWLAKIKLADTTQFDALLSAEQYKLHCDGAAETS